MKLLKNITRIGAAAVLIMFTSCRGDLMDLNPYGSVSSGSMWTTESLCDQGVTGIYNMLYFANIGSDIYKFESFGVSSDCRDQDYPILFNSATSNNGLFSGYWQNHYEGIHRANDAIANLPGTNAISDAGKKARLIAEAKFFRAYFYYKLNMVFKGVPLYLEPVELDEMTRTQETEAKIWETVITDLTDCINESNLPDKYTKGNANFGRITKSAAYALRGKVYMWLQEWAKAEADLAKVGDLGHKLFDGDYKQLFKEANEQSDEAIFSIQCLPLAGYGNTFSFRYGSRMAYEQGWNTYLVSADFVDTYECADGSAFNWDDYIPGYSQMEPKARAVYFLRDGLTDAEYKKMQDEQGADMSKYLPAGNEARIQAVYANRDPRLAATVITPYSQYNGNWAGVDHTYTLRWPYRGADAADPYDLRTDTNNRFYYLFRKFVSEGAEIASRNYSQIDIPLIRYADVLLSRAEAINEQGFSTTAVDLVNLVRERAGAALLQTTDASKPTYVSGQDDLRKRIRNERRWEFAGEAVNYFDELRWKTWQETKFPEGAGLKQIWGQNQYTYRWAGDHLYRWPVPKAEKDMNPSLEQVAGWN